MASGPVSPKVQVALDLLTAYENVDLEKIASLLSDDCEYLLLPKSFDGSKRNKTEMLNFISPFLPAFKSLKFTVHEIIEGSEKVVLHVSSVGESKSGSSYANEYAFIFGYSVGETEETKITSMKELLDSKFIYGYFHNPENWK